MAKRSEITKAKMRESALRRWATAKEEERKPIQLKQSVAKTLWWAALTPEQRREQARKSAETRRKKG